MKRDFRMDLEWELAFQVNTHQKFLAAGKSFSNQVNKMVYTWMTFSFHQQPQGFHDKFMVAGMEIIQVLNSMDFSSPTISWLLLGISAQFCSCMTSSDLCYHNRGTTQPPRLITLGIFHYGGGGYEWFVLPGTDI